MHMADALISPAVGGTMWAASAALIAYSAKKLKQEADDRKIPLMGVLGAFIFAAQMINFSIPATGSSGHLGGGMILAILLGPYAAFLVMASVLTVQALFFADGGVLALGCNIFNLAFFTCFVAYPLVYRRIARHNRDQGRIVLAALFSSIIGLQLGAFFVVLQTVFSGISSLPFTSFLFLMQPIHLAIGMVEGLVTAAVVLFVWKARPEILIAGSAAPVSGTIGSKKVIIGLLAAAVITGGVLSWFASGHPDGLEWSMFRAAGTQEIGGRGEGIHASLAAFQEKTALLPDYGFRSAQEPQDESVSAWPAVNAQTSVSGLVGGALTLALAIGIAWLIRRRPVEHRA